MIINLKYLLIYSFSFIVLKIKQSLQEKSTQIPLVFHSNCHVNLQHPSCLEDILVKNHQNMPDLNQPW